MLKQTAILIAAAIFPACAQVSSVPRYHAPIQGKSERGDGTATSANWSGYAVTGTAFTKATGSWIVPAITCKSGLDFAVFWVGIDGWTSSTVEQTGTEGICVGSAAIYTAWYEFYPALSVPIPSIRVHAGDKMAGSIIYSTATAEFTVEIRNETTGQSFSKSESLSSAARTSAECIAEAPSAGIVLPLADYGTVLFGEDNTGLGGCTAEDSTNEGAFGAFPAAAIYQITMEKNNVVESVPSILSSDGSSFSVTWAAP